MMYKISYDKVGRKSVKVTTFTAPGELQKESLFFNGGGTDIQVATQEPKSRIGFTTYVVDVAFPTLTK
jgi:hypothetical protein